MYRLNLLGVISESAYTQASSLQMKGVKCPARPEYENTLINSLVNQVIPSIDKRVKGQPDISLLLNYLENYSTINPSKIINTNEKAFLTELHKNPLPSRCLYSILQNTLFPQALKFYQIKMYLPKLGITKNTVSDAFLKEIAEVDISKHCSGEGGRLGRINLVEKLLGLVRDGRNLLNDLVKVLESTQGISLSTGTTPSVTEQNVVDEVKKRREEEENRRIQEEERRRIKEIEDERLRQEMINRQREEDEIKRRQEQLKREEEIKRQQQEEARKRAQDEIRRREEEERRRRREDISKKIETQKQPTKQPTVAEAKNKTSTISNIIEISSLVLSSLFERDNLTSLLFDKIGKFERGLEYLYEVSSDYYAPYAHYVYGLTRNVFDLEKILGVTESRIIKFIGDVALIFTYAFTVLVLYTFLSKISLLLFLCSSIALIVEKWFGYPLLSPIEYELAHFSLYLIYIPLIHVLFSSNRVRIYQLCLLLIGLSILIQDTNPEISYMLKQASSTFIVIGLIFNYLFRRKVHFLNVLTFLADEMKDTLLLTDHGILKVEETTTDKNTTIATTTNQ
ncbi:hypothetical protein ABK040_010160 [Willaertia magna]